MDNYSSEEILEFKEKSNQFHGLLGETVNWVRNNLTLNEQENLLNEVLTKKSEVATISKSIDIKPVFALFGVSQVGKSYLVKNLLSLDGENLEISLNNGKKLDFLKEINPKGGGTESTGVVCRFTIDSISENNDFPIKVKLLEVKDIVLILCDSFFSDIMKMNDYPTKEDFNEHLKRFDNVLNTEQANQSTVNEDDIYYIKQYFESFLERMNPLASTVSNTNFWLEISNKIKYIESHRWVELFEILWSKENNYSELFRAMLNGLEKLNFAAYVMVSENAILRDSGKILDVERVELIFKNEVNTPVQFSNGNIKDFNINLLSALTSEISLPLDKSVAEEKKFLNTTDLLDFPGARSRKPYEKIELKWEMMPNLFLRGKVSYLFNKYSSNYEINNLLFCLKNFNNEVKEIPILINEWIKRNVGATSQEREQRIGKNGVNPLLVVLTFYNETMKFNPNSDGDDLSDKWNNRFIKLFKEETVTKANDWDVNWTLSSSNFKSFYPLRDFQFSDDIFEGFAQNNREEKVNDSRLEYYAKLKESFTNFPYVKEHFDNPADAWEKSSTPNQDGSSRILSDLLPAANNLVKTKNYISRLEDFNSDIQKKLQPYFKTDDIQTQRNKAISEGVKIREQLRRLFRDNSAFGAYLSKMYLTNTEVYNYIHENYLPASRDHNPSPEEVFIRTYSLIPGGELPENRDILKTRLSFTEDSELDSWLEKQGIDLEFVLRNVHISTASSLVDGVLNIWQEKLNIENFKHFSANGLDLSVVDLINSNLLETFEMFKVRNTLIHLFENKTRLIRLSSDTEEYLASIITSYINDFVSNFGFNFMSEDRKNQVISLASTYQEIELESLMIRSNEVSEYEISKLFDEDDSTNDLTITFPVVDHYKNFITKIQLILLSNCGFRNYDVEANSKLEKLISQISHLNFNN